MALKISSGSSSRYSDIGIICRREEMKHSGASRPSKGGSGSTMSWPVINRRAIKGTYVHRDEMRGL